MANELQESGTKNSIQTEIFIKEVGSEEGQTFIITDQNEFTIDDDDLKPNTKYEVRVRNRYVRSSGDPLTGWGPWSPSGFFETD